jgi:hypothetical protein
MPRVDRLRVTGTHQPRAQVDRTLDQILAASDLAPAARVTMRDMLQTIKPGQRLRVHGHGRDEPIVVTVLMIATDRWAYKQEHDEAPVITHSYGDAGCCPYFLGNGEVAWNNTNYITRMTQRPPRRRRRRRQRPADAEATPAVPVSRGRGLSLT